MLSVVNSGKFTLTLQSTPPFVIENIFALALAVLLAVPLITSLQFYLEELSKEKRNIRNARIVNILSNESYRLNENYKESNEKENSSERIRRAVIMHYPAPLSIGTSSSSDLDLRVGTLSHKSVSTPNIRSNCDKDGSFKNENYKIAIKENDQHVHEFFQKITPGKDALLDLSSSFVATNSELPIIDISTFNYNSYRYKLIEASLKKRYRERQPPGDVIFNSIHLNTTDSTLGIKLNEEYDHSFFDFVEDYYDATSAMSRKEMEFLHPLDYFLVRDGHKCKTSEKATETISCTRNQMDQHGGVINNKSIDRYAIDKNGNISKTKGKNLFGITNKLENESLRSMNSRKDFVGKEKAAAADLDNSNSTCTRITMALRTGKSPDRKKLSNETLNSSNPASLIVKGYKDSISVRSNSSDELGSAYSESVKRLRGNDSFNHSRDSSESPSRGRTAATRKPLPWITGNSSVSFNRKYGNKSSVTSGVGSSKRKVRSSERPSTRFYPRATSLRPRSANLNREFRKTNYQNSSKLKEVVKSKENYTTNEEKLMKSKKPEISLLESITDRSYANFQEKRDRTNEKKSMKTMTEEDCEKSTSGINYRDPVMAMPNFKCSNSDNRSSKAMTSHTDRTNIRMTHEGYESMINELIGSREESALCQTSYEKKPKNAVVPKIEAKSRIGASLSNLDKTCELSAIASKDSIVLATNDSRSKKERFSNQSILSKENDNVTNVKSLTNEKNIREEFRLPGGDSKVGLAMQTSLKNYIKTLKQILKNGENANIADLTSLSLKDAISPELESILSSSELKELQDLLNIAEIKSNLLVN